MKLNAVVHLAMFLGFKLPLRQFKIFTFSRRCCWILHNFLPIASALGSSYKNCNLLLDQVVRISV